MTWRTVGLQSTEQVALNKCRGNLTIGTGDGDGYSNDIGYGDLEGDSDCLFGSRDSDYGLGTDADADGNGYGDGYGEGYGNWGDGASSQ